MIRTSDIHIAYMARSDVPGLVVNTFARMTNCNGTGVRKTPGVKQENLIIRQVICSIDGVLPITGACNQSRNPLEPQPIFLLETREGKAI